MGDEILAAGQAQRLWDEDPSTRIAVVDQFRMPRWHWIWNGNPILARPEHVEAGETVRRVQNAPGCRPYIVYPFTKESGWTFNTDFRCRDHVARLYLTPQELAVGQKLRDRLGPYVLIEPFTKHANHRWPFERWAELVESCPGVTFVQHTHGDTTAIVPGAASQPTTFREACALVKFADCYVRSESGLCHAAAALGVPQVTLFGGCMDPEVMGGYDGQIVIADEDEGSPCGAWNPCAHCTAAMSRITVDMVAGALRRAVRARRAA